MSRIKADKGWSRLLFADPCYYSARLPMSLQCTRPFPTLPNWTGEGKERGPLATKQLAEWQKLCSWRQTSQQEKPLLLLKCITQMLVILYAVLFRCIRLGKHKHTLSLSLFSSLTVLLVQEAAEMERERREKLCFWSLLSRLLLL